MKRILSVLLIVCTLLSALPVGAFALSWDGSTTGGGTNLSYAGANGYAIRKGGDNCIGYRFSAVISAGTLKGIRVIDVFRNTGYGDLGYSSGYKFTAKYNKKQLIGRQNEGFSTSSNTTNCYKEVNCRFYTTFPAPSGMETWQGYESNINRILSLLGIGTVANMNYGDMVIIEPIYDIRLQSVYHAITVTETALYGKYILGASSDGGTSATAASWGFISSYTNRIYPNELYTPNGQGLWTSASAIADSGRATFYTLINTGYGAGIGYKETRNITYTIRFNGNGSTGGSTATMTMTYNTAKNLTTNGFTKTGNYFLNWNTKADGSGTAYTNGQSVNNLTSTNGAIIELYARWRPYALTLQFDANGGSTSSTFYSTSGAEIYWHNGDYRVQQTNKYNVIVSIPTAAQYELFKTGYTAGNWSTAKSGGTQYSQGDTSKTVSALCPSIANGAQTMTLYMLWNPISYTVKFNGNGSTGGSTASLGMTYDVSKNLTSNGFTKTGYHFAGWNTKADGTGTAYYNGQSVRNMTTVNGTTINLYAQWSTNSYSIAFNGNGYTGGVTSGMTMNFNQAKNLTANGYTKTGYYFNSWNTKADGTGTKYTDKQSVNNLTSTNGAVVYLYAQWTSISYTINFNGNGHTGGTMSPLTMQYDQAKNLTANAYTKTGYHFIAWNSRADGTGSSYTDKQSVKNLTSVNNGSVTLYAQWEINQYTVTFNGNGATGGSTANMTLKYNETKALTANGFTRTEYKFVCWNTKADGSGTKYSNQQSVVNLSTVNGATVTLYAQWEYDPELRVISCDAYRFEKGNIAVHYGQSTGSSYTNYTCDEGYPVVWQTVWFKVKFPKASQNIRARQYVRCGGDWITRDVTIDSQSYAQEFSVQFEGDDMTVSPSRKSFIIEAKTDYIDANGNVLKAGQVYSFYIPVCPYVYRDKVIAYGYDGNICADMMIAAKRGTLYSGQRVKLRYQYSTINQWDVQEYLVGSLHEYLYGDWKTVYPQNNGKDVYCSNVSMSADTPTQAVSSLNPYTVPKTDQGKIRVLLETWWPVDKLRTHERTWIDVPVIPSDVAMEDIILVNPSTGSEYSRTSLVMGTKTEVRYVCRNNTNTKVYVEVFGVDGDKLDGVYEIPANSSITVSGGEYIVPEENEFSLWAGVYLEGLGKSNTEYETDGSNNAMTVLYKTKYPLSLELIRPNADYKANTDVITSFRLINKASTDCTPSNRISAKFVVYYRSTAIKTVIMEQVVVPGKNNNMLYFKWRVPTGISSNKVKITGEIIDSGVSYNRTTYYLTTTPYTTAMTPDTAFEKNAPANFTISTAPKLSRAQASWSEWHYENRAFRKITYGVGISESTPTLTPATSSTAIKNGSNWTIKSGYGLSLSVNNSMASVQRYIFPDSSAYTMPQYACAYFPEFKYKETVGNFKTLSLTGSIWTFPENGTYGSVHFTPLWYPNGKYIVGISQSDCWTPAGMITRRAKSNIITITDAAYDDWFVGR